MADSVGKILIKVGNDKTLSLFKTIVTAEQNTDSRDLREKLKLTRKQCYTILSGLVEAGLVKKINTRQYFVTTLGRIVYDSISRIEIAYSNHIPLKAIDSINMSDEVPKKERIEIIGELIKNEEIRRIYLQASLYIANQK